MSVKMLTVGIILITMLPMPVFADKVLSVDLEIHFNDTASLKSLSSVEGNLIDLIPGEYTGQILDSKGRVLDSKDFLIEFFLFTDPPQEIDAVPIELRFSSYENAKELQILHDDKLIFESPIALCDNNKICDKYENYLSCSMDCPSGSADNYCDHLKDGKCDPDCAEQADEDCLVKEQESTSSSYLIYVLAGVGLVVIIILISFFLKKRKQA